MLIFSVQKNAWNRQKGEVFLFKIGDWLIYGGKGVCKVIGIGPLESAKSGSDRPYYTLEPKGSGSRVFTPVDNQKVIMRPIISKEDALELIDHMEEIDLLWITDEKHREDHYKEALRTCDCREWIKMIKTIYTRKQKRLQQGKKMTSSDERFFKIAEDHLYNEFGLALGMESGEVETFITERVEQSIS